MIWTVVLYWMHDSEKYEIEAVRFRSYWRALLFHLWRALWWSRNKVGYWSVIERRNIVEVKLMVEHLHSPHSWLLV